MTLQNLTPTSSPDNNVISSTGPLGAIEVVVYNDHNEIPLSLNTSETTVVVKNTAGSGGMAMSGGDGDSNVTITKLDDEILAEAPLTYAVVFRTYGGSPVEGLSGQPYNSLVAQPEDPTFPGFIFAWWYKDAECTDGQEWDFNADRITEDTTIHAKWDEDEGFLHEVRFKAEGFDDMVIIVYDGDSINNVPAVPLKKGYSGEWDISNFTNIQQDILVNAIYTALASSDADLSSLTVSVGTLTPVFDPATTAFTVAVAHEVVSIDVTADLTDECASLTIGGVPATSGVLQTVTLNPTGTTTVIDIAAAICVAEKD